MSFKKPWSQEEADRLVSALTPMVGAYNFGVTLANTVIPDPKSPDVISLDIKPTDPKAEDLNPNTAKLICWLRDVWGKPTDTIKNGPFNPFTYARGEAPQVPAAPRREPAALRRGGVVPVAARANGDGGAAELIRQAGRAFGAGGGGAGIVDRAPAGWPDFRAGLVQAEDVPPQDFPPQPPPLFAEFNAAGQAVDNFGNILGQDGLGNYYIIQPNPEQFFGEAPAKKGTKTISDTTPRFHYGFMRNDMGLILVKVW